MRILIGLILACVLVLAAGLFATRPVALPSERFSDVAADAARGEYVFTAAGCASCHMAPDDTDPTRLPGGRRFATRFGTFVAPNISPDPEEGIGDWTLAQFASAVKKGVSPEGAHYYPVFPFASYARMTDEDVASLWSYIRGLPPLGVRNQPHEVSFPFSIRASLGGWKLLHLDGDWVAPEGTPGRYLVEALGHCAECHTPRDATGGLDRDRWMTGAPLPVGEGRVPALTPDTLTWSEDEIAYYLDTGFTPEFDSAGGEMAEVIRNTSKLTPEDRAAIAAYVKALPLE